MKSGIKNIIYILDDVLGIVALIGIVSIVGANVFFRFVLNNPITWTEEVSLAFFVWLTFVGMSSAMKRNTHVGIDYFIRKLPNTLTTFFQVTRLIIIYFLTIYVFIYLGFQLTVEAGSKVTPVLGINYQYINFALPLGGFLIILHLSMVILKKDMDYVRQNKGGI